MKRYGAMLLATALALSACGYQVQDYLPSNVKAIYVPLFKNVTDRYGLEEKLTDQTIKRFLVDGTLQIENERNSQAVLEVSLNRYLLIPLVYDVNNLVEEYKMVLSFNIRLVDLVSGEVIWQEDEANAVEVFYTQYSEEAVNRNDAREENEVLESLVDKSADKIVERVVRGWWVEEEF